MFEDITRQLSSIGGPVLAVLFFISIVATATSIFKVIQFFRLGVGSHSAANASLAKWNIGEKKLAYDIAAKSSSPLSLVAAQTMHSLGLVALTCIVNDLGVITWNPVDPEPNNVWVPIKPY